MTLRALNRVALGVALLLCLALTAFGQSDNSTISGVVKDPSGASVANAKVTVKNESTEFERRTTTNETGFFTVPNIAPGNYTVTVEAPGFKMFVKTRNTLQAALPMSMNIDLTVGAVTETINVEASVAQLNTESATVGKTVEQMQIQNLTLNGRNPLFLALLKPGVRGGALSGFSFGLTSGGLSINGGRSQDSLITFDGAVGVRTRANGTSIGTADLDTVQEVQILTANYSAEYGRSAAGQVRMVTKSGTKQFHGTVYEYFRNSALDANSWGRNLVSSTNFVAPFRYNQFGYNINGPVTLGKFFNKDREKLFFLFSQEWVRYRQEQTATARVPSALMRQGNFSELLSSNIWYSGVNRVITDPSGSPYPGNIIPQSQLSPNGIAFLRTYPNANGAYPGNNNYLQVRPNPQNQRKDTLAIDYNPTQSQVFRIRWANYNYDVVDAFRGQFDYAVSALDRPNMTGSVGHIWTINPTTINEFLVSGSVDRVTIAVDPTGQRYLRSTRGINYPYIYPGKEIDDKIPTLVIPSLNDIDGGPYPARSAGPIYQISNNLTKILGNHTLKAGVLWERSGQNDFDQINVSGVPGGTNNQNGRFQFTDDRTNGTGIGMANAALGLFTTYAEIGPRSYTPYRGHMFEFFAQDSWRVNSKLKLELGFRATWQNGYYKSLWGNIAYFDPSKYNAANAAVLNPTTGNVISGDRYNGVVIPGSEFPEAGKGRVPAIDSGEFNRLLSGGSPYPSQNQFNILPRLGLAYQISNKDVIRAGVGGFASRPGVYDSVFLGGNPPWQPMVSVQNGSADRPGGGAQTAFPQFFMTIDPVYKIPLSYNWNISYQRDLFNETTLEVGYVGTTGNYLSRERDLNQLPTGTLFRPENLGPDGRPRYNVNFLRPFKGFANIPMLEQSGRSEYNALQLELNRRFKRSVSYGLAYTWSKSMDGNSGPRDGFVDVYNQGINWGKSSFDTRHSVVVNFIWEMPFFRQTDNKMLKLGLGGWQLSGVTQFQTGTPFTIARNDDYLGIGSANGKPWNINGTIETPFQFANRNAAGNYTGITDYYFNPARNAAGQQTIASMPANGTLPNQNRNSLTFQNPGFQNWNLALFKAFQITERQAVQFRFEAFNWLNHPNWDGVNTDPLSANFGLVTTKSSQRNLQLSLRYSF